MVLNMIEVAVDPWLSSKHLHLAQQLLDCKQSELELLTMLEN
jgi:hypothetical protein